MSLRAVVGDLQPHRVAEVAVQQLALQRGAQVLDLLLVDEQVGVARDAELVAAHHLHAGEQLADVRVQDRREEDERVLARRRSPAAGGSRAAARAAPARSRRASSRPKASRPSQLDDEVQALVEHARERMRRVEADRRQHRQQLAEEVVADPLALRRAPLLAPREARCLPRASAGSTTSFSSWYWSRDERVRLAGSRRRTPRPAARPSGPGSGRPSLICSFSPATRISKNSSRLRRDDGDEAQPLEQRHRVVGRLRQHAAVEREDAELAIEELGRAAGFCGSSSRPWTKR